jgi:type IV secretory pathway ATPase VirB11/archaellum biosynthesis ATPase
MPEIKESTARVVAGDAQSMVSALDMALLQQARLCASIVETAAESQLPISSSQPVLAAMTEGMNRLVDSRASMEAAIRKMSVIQRNSNLGAVSFGCPNGFFRTPAPAFASAAQKGNCELVA